MEAALRTLRNRSVKTPAFRRAAGTACSVLIRRLRTILRKRDIAPERVVFIVVLRAGMAFVEHALAAFPSARLGVVGLRRDETTAKASWYYENLPPLDRRDTVVILDPMLATGGSATATVEHAIAAGAAAKNVYMVAVLAAPEGIAALATVMPGENMVLGAVDRGLDARKFIVPGLGDFGDRYCGHAGPRNKVG